jgi:hypothetical protein
MCFISQYSFQKGFRDSRLISTFGGNVASHCLSILGVVLVSSIME